MATTKGKDSSTSSWVGKEKRVASPSSNSRTSTATTPKSTTRAINTSTSRPSSSTVPAAHKAAASSTTAASTEKQVPSYLRPTISSRPESRSFKYVKKRNTPAGHEDTATQQKAAQTRRKSLDKPLSYNSRQLSTTTAPLLSPGHRERTITARSTSFAHRSSTISLEPVVGRTSKLTNKTAGKSVQASYVKKSTNSITKMENSTSPASGKLVPENIVHAVESEENDGDNCLVHEVDQDIAKVEGGDDADGPNSDQVVPEYENDKHTTDDHVVESEVMNSIIGEDEKLKSCDIPLVSEEKGVVPDAQTESEPGNKLREEKAENLPEGEDNNKSNGNNTESHPEEQSVEREEEVLLEVVKEEKGDHHDETDKNSGDENKNNGNSADENKGKEGGIEGFNSKELGQHDESGSLEETKPVVENSTRESASKPQGGQGNKKESSPAYNEVIEETASKLMEKRKNKVKALVGAFETVIDKEAAASSTK